MHECKHPGPAPRQSCAQSPPVLRLLSISGSQHSAEVGAGARPRLREEGQRSLPFFHPSRLFAVSFQPLSLTRPKVIVQIAQDNWPQGLSLVTGSVSALTPPG